MNNINHGDRHVAEGNFNPPLNPAPGAPTDIFYHDPHEPQHVGLFRVEGGPHPFDVHISQAEPAHCFHPLEDSLPILQEDILDDDAPLPPEAVLNHENSAESKFDAQENLPVAAPLIEAQTPYWHLPIAENVSDVPLENIPLAFHSQGSESLQSSAAPDLLDRLEGALPSQREAREQLRSSVAGTDRAELLSWFRGRERLHRLQTAFNNATAGGALLAERVRNTNSPFERMEQALRLMNSTLNQENLRRRVPILNRVANSLVDLRNRAATQMTRGERESLFQYTGLLHSLCDELLVSALHTL